MSAQELGYDAREILIFRRGSGYLRLHVPPLLYVRSLALTLDRALRSIEGVRKVVIDPTRSRLSIFYDPWVATDRKLLLEIDRLATPLLSRMEPAQFALALREQALERNERLGGKAMQGIYLTALAGVHFYLLRSWVFSPLRYWWAWGLVGFGVYTHRRQIRAIPKLP